MVPHSNVQQTSGCAVGVMLGVVVGVAVGVLTFGVDVGPAHIPWQNPSGPVAPCVQKSCPVLQPSARPEQSVESPQHCNTVPSGPVVQKEVHAAQSARASPKHPSDAGITPWQTQQTARAGSAPSSSPATTKGTSVTGRPIVPPINPGIESPARLDSRDSEVSMPQ
jgi:hypothetical protein